MGSYKEFQIAVHPDRMVLRRDATTLQVMTYHLSSLMCVMGGTDQTSAGATRHGLNLMSSVSHSQHVFFDTVELRDTW